ncbi:MAG: hypothetical protein KAX84_01665 [Burkholderiales bacterium]|nr:hypothetical protein [Burkholderiales bacterium]
MARYTKTERAEALERLRNWLSPGDTVHCILRNVSRSGMSREIGLVINVDGHMLHPNHAAAAVLGERLGKRDGVIVQGCGMDMGFHLVYSLSHVLFPEGFGIEGKGPHGHVLRPKTPAAAAKAVARGYVFRGRNCDASGWDSDGGYALRHSWL